MYELMDRWVLYLTGKGLSINAHQPTQQKKRPSHNQYQNSANLLLPPLGALLSALPSAGLQTYTRPPPHHSRLVQLIYRLCRCRCKINDLMREESGTSIFFYPPRSLGFPDPYSPSKSARSFPATLLSSDLRFLNIALVPPRDCRLPWRLLPKLHRMCIRLGCNLIVEYCTLQYGTVRVERQ